MLYDLLKFARSMFYFKLYPPVDDNLQGEEFNFFCVNNCPKLCVVTGGSWSLCLLGLIFYMLLMVDNGISPVFFVRF